MMSKSPDKQDSQIGSRSARIVQLVWTLVAVTVGALATANLVLYRAERETVYAALDQSVRPDARGYAQYFMLNMSIVDRLLISMRKQFAEGPTLPLQASINADLKELSGMVLQVAIANAEGSVVYSSLGTHNPPVSIADRPYFLAVKGKTEDQLFISEPVLGRVSKKMSLQLVRPIFGPDRNFKGVIVASMDPELLKNYFTNLDALDNNGRLTILGTDGIVRFRLTDQGFSAGQDIKKTPQWQQINSSTSGLYDDLSPIDNIKRRVAFERVPGFPLSVAVGKGIDAVSAEFQKRWVSILILSGVLSLMLVFVGVTITTLMKTQRRAYQLAEINRQQALESDRSKSRFLASVSHELRTPLNSILGFSELIRDTCAEPRSSQFAGLIHKSGEHLHALVNTVLDLAKIESGKMGLTIETVKIQSLLETLVAIHKVSADQKKVELSLSIDGVVKSSVKTDRTKLVQIFNNVIHNALKFTETGAIFVVLKPAGETGVLVSVTDTGVGIAPAELKTVFERFNTVTSPLDGPAGKGSGLGLALCQELLTLLGGTIDLESEPGQGTTVNIFVPYSITQKSELA